jgi:hypothetical protein
MSETKEKELIGCVVEQWSEEYCDAWCGRRCNTDFDCIIQETHHEVANVCKECKLRIQEVPQCVYEMRAILEEIMDGKDGNSDEWSLNVLACEDDENPTELLNNMYSRIRCVLSEIEGVIGKWIPSQSDREENGD